MPRRISLCAVVLMVAGAWCSAAHAQQTLTFSDADLHFMALTAESGAGEVELGQLAATRAASDAVRRFGQRMVTDHSAATAQLRQLAQQKGVILPLAPSPQTRATYDRLATMSGGEFDRTYIVEMVNQHDRTVGNFEAASQTARDPDLRTWVIATLPVVREHQRLARELNGFLAAQPPPAALPATVVVVPPMPEPLWCAGTWRLAGGSNFGTCPR
jgi:putative membrane protein